MRWCVLFVALSIGGCTGASAFACHDASDCTSAATDGTCELTGYCSFPADDCDSGRRYGEHAPADLAGACVPTDDDTGTVDPTLASDPVTTVGGETSADSTTTALPLDGTSSTSAPATTMGVDDDTTTTLEGEASSTTASPIDVVYDAAIAVCTQDTVFDPMACAEEAGPQSFTVDLADGGGLVSTGWLRFDLDDTLVDATIVSIELSVVVGSETGDNSGSTGELWTTEPFDLQTLTVGNPATAELVGEDLGLVVLGEEIVWSLPPELFDPTESLYFAIVPVATDGIDLLDATSAMPPRLRISAL